jgi:hypothetical protein
LQNVTATAVAAMSSASGGKIELISRIFADTGVSSLMKGILQLVCKYQNKERIIKIHNKFVPMDPREWNTEYNVTVNVGLGTGSKSEQLGVMQMILDKQEQMLTQYGLSNPLVSLKQYRDTLAKFVNMAGFKDESGFLKDISQEQSDQLAQQQAQQPKTDPTTEATKILAEVKREKAQMKMQTDQQKLELDRMKLEMESAKAMLKLEQEKVEFEKEMAIKELELMQKAEESDAKVTQGEMKVVVDALDKINNIAGM